MRFFQIRQYEMLQSIRGYLEKKKNDLYPRVPLLKKLIPEYFERFGELDKLVTGKIKITEVATSEKSTAKGGLVDSTLKLVDVVRTSHSSGGREKIPAEARYTFSDLNRASIESLIQKCAKVIELAKEVPHLAEYGISEGDIKEAEAYLEEFKAVKKGPKLKKEEIAGWNREIRALIRDCILFLEDTLDPMMRMATRDSKELKLGYFSRRKILQRGAGNIQQIEARYRKSRKKANEKQKVKRKSRK